jgi:hypothetical protein
MKYKSTILADARGPLGGLVSSGSRGGLFAKSRPVPCNPNSPLQLFIRSHFSFLTKAWSNLSAANRSGWSAYANAISHTNNIGHISHLTGQQHFVRSNIPRLRYLGPTFIVNNPPQILSLPAPAVFSSPVAYIDSNGQLLLSVLVSQFFLSQNWNSKDYFIVSASPPVSPSVQKCRKSFFLFAFNRFTKFQIQPALFLLPFHYESWQGLSYHGPYIPNLPGHRVFFKAHASRTDGRLSMPFSFSVLLSAPP